MLMCIVESCRVALRYVIAVMGFFGIFCAIATRGCINVAIVVMVNCSDDDSSQLVNNSDMCPPHHGLNVTVRPSPQVCQYQCGSAFSSPSFSK